MRAEIAAGRVAACHDLSDGGLLVAHRRDGDGRRHGVALDPLPTALRCIAWLFGEDQARYLIETADPDAVLAAARAAGVAGARHRRGRRAPR